MPGAADVSGTPHSPDTTPATSTFTLAIPDVPDSYGTTAFTWPADEYSSGAGTPLTNTLPLTPRPKMLKISPGASEPTAPEAAFTMLVICDAFIEAGVASRVTGTVT